MIKKDELMIAYLKARHCGRARVRIMVGDRGT